MAFLLFTVCNRVVNINIYGFYVNFFYCVDDV